MAGNNHSSNIKVYQKKRHLNIGIVIFGVIFIYLIVTVLMYLTEKHISVPDLLFVMKQSSVQITAVM